MSDEIKEIFIRMNDLIEHQFDKEYHTKCDLFKDIQGLLDYITNLQEENDRLNNIKKYAIQFININQDEKTFALDYYDLKKLRGILNDDDFYIELFKEQLKELKENKWNKNYSINTQK